MFPRKMALVLILVAWTGGTVAFVAAKAEKDPPWFVAEGRDQNILWFESPTEHNAGNHDRRVAATIGRWRDKERKVTCWIVYGPQPATISCLPDRDLGFNKALVAEGE